MPTRIDILAAWNIDAIAVAIILTLTICFLVYGAISAFRDDKRNKAAVNGPLIRLRERGWRMAYACMTPECTRVVFVFSLDMRPTICSKCGGTDLRQVVAREVDVIGKGKGERTEVEVKGLYIAPPEPPIRPEGWVCLYCGTLVPKDKGTCPQCGGGG